MRAIVEGSWGTLLGPVGGDVAFVADERQSWGRREVGRASWDERRLWGLREVGRVVVGS